jgi:long-chain acyl-CoA synthetase
MYKCVSQITMPDDVDFGAVGGVIPAAEIKLADCPDMGYTSDDKPYPRGEVCIRGPIVSKGYYQLDDKTKEDFKESQDGSPYKWFHTGDVGQFDEYGRLSIVDRKKDLVKLRHGEYIALGKIESYLTESKYVDNICLHGNGSIDRPVALVVVNTQKIMELSGSSTSHVSDIVQNADVAKKVLQDMSSAAQKHGVNKNEIPTHIKLLSDPWTADTGLVTEAMKLKRNPIEKKFSKELDALYKEAGGKFKEE